MTQAPVQNEPIVTEGTLPPPDTAPKKKRLRLWVSLGIAALLLFGGAAFLASRFFIYQSPTHNQNGPMVSTGLNAQQSVKINPGNFGPWTTEIPQSDPNTQGLFLNRQDNVLTIGTGNVTFGTILRNEAAGAPEASAASYSGPQVEVVVTGQSQAYRDATMDDLTNGIPHNRQIQPKLLQAHWMSSPPPVRSPFGAARPATATSPTFCFTQLRY